MRRISYCLNSQLVEICQRVVLIDELNHKVCKHLPHHLQHVCTINSFNKGCLTLSIKDAAQATELRYFLPTLRDNLRKDGLYQLSSIKLLVQADRIDTTVLKEPKKLINRALSTKAKESINRVAEHCTHRPLKDALLNLARFDDRQTKL